MEFTRKEKREAQNYALYMIAASYFLSASCPDGNREARGRQIYLLLGHNEQYRMEDAAIELMEKHILKLLSPAFLQSAVQVRFLPDAAGIRISCPGHRLEIRPAAGRPGRRQENRHAAGRPGHRQ